MWIGGGGGGGGVTVLTCDHGKWPGRIRGGGGGGGGGVRVTSSDLAT